MRNPQQNLSKASLFHEYWWLEAVAAGRFSEVQVTQGDFVAGRLPFCITKRKGLRTLGMPDFTHLLGPVVNSSDGKPQTRITNRLSTVGALISQLPPFDFFKQVIDPAPDDGLALIDGLAFQMHGFQVGYQYTFQIDCRANLDALLAGMNVKVRQPLRRAEEQRTVVTIDDSQRFVSFYMENLRKMNRRSYMQFDRFPILFSECRARNCGEILAAVGPDGAPVAMTFVVWDDRKMYYLMSTRDTAVRDTGSVNLLIWSAMKRAHERGLIFDLDGVSNEGTARFLSGFGGTIKTRLVVTKGQPVYNVVQSVKTIMRGGRSAQSTFT
jgi:lipid II:glycine glycyltransferase (peptidoglycan interpeptide bridge formation enzyme)